LQPAATITATLVQLTPALGETLKLPATFVDVYRALEKAVVQIESEYAQKKVASAKPPVS
jgi:hypothetical protein